MTAPKKKPKSKKPGPKKKKGRTRIAHQITLSPESTKIVERWVERAGEGTKSIHIDMAIRFAEKSNLFAGDLLAPAPVAPKVSIEEALIKHAPELLQRLVDNMTGKTPAPPTAPPNGGE